MRYAVHAQCQNPTASCGRPVHKGPDLQEEMSAEIRNMPMEIRDIQMEIRNLQREIMIAW